MSKRGVKPMEHNMLEIRMNERKKSIKLKKSLVDSRIIRIFEP